MANSKKMDYVLLGLLSHTPMTGYEIKKKMDVSLRLFWNGSYGSIYPTLNQLEHDGKIIGCPEKAEGRQRLRYTITEVGIKSLKEWLALPVEKDELRYETLLKLFFGNELGNSGTLEHIERFEKNVQQELPLLHAIVDQLEHYQEEDAHKYYELTAKFGIYMYEAFLKWTAEAKTVLEEEN